VFEPHRLISDMEGTNDVTQSAFSQPKKSDKFCVLNPHVSFPISHRSVLTHLVSITYTHPHSDPREKCVLRNMFSCCVQFHETVIADDEGQPLYNMICRQQVTHNSLDTCHGSWE
jgi:hypothetical protein